MGLDSDDTSTTPPPKEEGDDDECVSTTEDFDPSLLYLFKFLRQHIQLRNSHLDFDRLQHELTGKFTSACVNSGTALLNLEHYVEVISQQPEDQTIDPDVSVPDKPAEEAKEEEPEAIFSFGGGGFGRFGGGGGGFGFGSTSSALFDTPAKEVKKTPPSFDPSEVYRAALQLLSTQIADNPHLLPTYTVLPFDRSDGEFHWNEKGCRRD